MDAATVKALLSPRALALALTAMFPISMSVIFLTGLWVCGGFALRVVRLLLQLTVSRGTSLDAYGARRGAWAVVTGASDGIGREFALQLAAKGFNVALVSRTPSKLDKVAKEILALPGEKVSVVQHAIDFANVRESEWAALEAALAKLRIGVLVNNAAMSHRAEWSEFITAPAQEHVNIIDVNVTAAVRMTRMVLPGMVSHKRGLVLNIGSLAGGAVSVPLWATYSGTKTFLVSWTQAIAAEMRAAKTGVDVTAVLAGYVAGGMAKQIEASFHTPTTAQWVRCVLSSIGISGGSLSVDFVSTPYWAHGLLYFIVHEFSLHRIFRNTMYDNIMRRGTQAAKTQ